LEDVIKTNEKLQKGHVYKNIMHPGGYMLQAFFAKVPVLQANAKEKWLL
jgi:hypothetical protein